MAKRKTHEKFIEDFQSRNTRAEKIRIVSEYINSSTKIECICEICGHGWSVLPYSLVGINTGCPKCANNIRKTQDGFLSELKNKHFNIFTKDIYINTHTYMTFKCSECHYEWISTPHDILNKKYHGCPNCYQIKKSLRYMTIAPIWSEVKRKKIEAYHKATLETRCKQHVEKLAINNPNIRYVSGYKNANKKCIHICLIHNKEFLISPSHAIRGQGCDECKGFKIGNAHRNVNNYLVKLKNKHDNIILIGEYVASGKPVEHKCLDCGYVWSPLPCNVIAGNGCPKCAKPYGEKQCIKVLEGLINEGYTYKDEYTFNDLKSVKGWALRFDFAIFKNSKLFGLIEYDGKFHFEKRRTWHNLEEQIERDNLKNEYCKKNNIPLLRIHYLEQDNIENKIREFIA